MFLDEKSELKALFRLRSGAHIELALLDISLCGCMIDRRGWSAVPDDRVLIKLPGLSFQPAIVIWVEDGRAGLEFEQALYEPVLEGLTQSLGRTAAT